MLQTAGSMDWYSEVVQQMAGMDPLYEDFCKAVLMVLRKPQSTDQEFHNYLNVTYHLYHMKQSGDKIYSITPELASRLSKTTVNIDSLFIKSPFREIYVRIDPGLYFLKDGEKLLPVCGFYIHVRDLKDSKQIRIMAVAFRSAGDESKYKDMNFYFRIELKPGKILEQIKVYLENIRSHEDELAKYGGGIHIDYEEDLLLFVINTLLYITSRDALLMEQEPEDISKLAALKKNPAKIKKFLQRADKFCRQRVIIVGSGIKDNDFKEIKDAGGVGFWKLKNRIRVAGHWKTQWYGSKKDSTRRNEIIWISDYEKGPEMAELLTTPHLVK
jgi:hypothetical protein